MIWDVLACAGGLALLTLAADHLVIGSSTLAVRFGVPVLVVGVVIIGFGTSSPELLVSALAALSGSPDVGAGNVVGSNIANLSFVLGAAALVAPLTVRSSIVRRELPVALAASAAFAYAIQNGLTRLEGAVLLLLLAGALTLLLRWARQPAAPDPLAAEVDEALEEQTAISTRREVVRTLFGLAGTLGGAQLLVTGALGVAESAGLSGGAVGLTIVAGGTSLPELATAVQAARRGEADLIIGNLLGSNMFNALAVGGLVAVIAPGFAGGTILTTVGATAMLATSVLALVLMRRGYVVNRIEGMILLVGYVVLVPVLASG